MDAVVRTRDREHCALPLGLAVAPADQVLSVLTASDPQTVIFVMVELRTMTSMAVMGTAPTVTLLDGTNSSCRDIIHAYLPRRFLRPP